MLQGCDPLPWELLNDNLFLHSDQFLCSEEVVEELCCPLCKNILFKAKGMYPQTECLYMCMKTLPNCKY